MSALGTKRTWHRGWLISAFGGKRTYSSPPASACWVCSGGEGRGRLVRQFVANATFRLNSHRLKFLARTDTQQ